MVKPSQGTWRQPRRWLCLPTSGPVLGLVLACGAIIGAAGSVCASGLSDATGAVDIVLEKRVAALTQELRCLVCQNQTIADSQAPLALELRRRVREQLAQGASERDVIDFMVQRYGDFVLYRPPLAPRTWLLWFGPLILAAVGLLLPATALRRHRRLSQKRLPEPLQERLQKPLPERSRAQSPLRPGGRP